MKMFIVVGFASLAITMSGTVSKAQQSSSNRAAPQDMHGMHDMPGMTMSQDDQPTEADIQANLAKLKPEDRKLAEAQKFCPIMTKNRLGAMGVPVKVMIKDQPVFLCCNGCQKKALANPDKTLASVAALVKANKKDEPAKK